MAIQLKSTKNISLDGVKICVYGQSGSGKTRLIASLPNPIIISAEAGLLTLNQMGVELPFLEIKSMNDLTEAYNFVTKSEEAKNFDSVVIDSISEVAEVALSHNKVRSKDIRAAYGEMQEQVEGIVRAFRDISGKHVYMTSKIDTNTDELGVVTYGCSAPGKKIGANLPYFFDELFCLHSTRLEDGTISSALQTRNDGKFYAKDRSGKLEIYEQPDLGAIIRKISGGPALAQVA